MRRRAALVVLVGLLAAAALGGCAGKPDPEPTAAPVPAWVVREATPLDDSASEVSIAVDPLDPLHAVAAANSGGFGVYETRDGGCTWTASTLAATDVLGPNGPVGALLSDPAVAFSPDGTLRIAGLAYVPLSNVFVASKAPGQTAWAPSSVWRSEVAGTFNDKEWIGISPSSGTMVVAWQREPAMDMLRGVEQTVAAAAGTSPDLDLGQVVVSRSTDNGGSWSLPQVVGPSLHNNGTQVQVTEDGAFHLVWVDYEQPALVHSVSTDDGATWSEPETVSDLHIAHEFAGFTRMHTLPGLATDGHRLAVVWHDSRNDTADVFVSRYDGQAWSQAERIPDDAGDTDRVQLYPWVAFDAAGSLHVDYYSATIGETVTYRTMQRNETGAWSKPVELGPPFLLVNGTRVADVGDYTGFASGGGSLYAAWAQPQSDGTGAGVRIASLREQPCSA